MTIARVDFDDEVWRLASVAVAVLQPVLVIVLLGVFWPELIDGVVGLFVRS